MRNILTQAETDALDDLLNDVYLSAILAHIAAQTYEAEDSVGSGALGQMAATVHAAQLFCKAREEGDQE